MYLLKDKRADGMYGILDTEDNVIEYYGSNDIISFARMGIEIQGISYKDNRWVFQVGQKKDILGELAKLSVLYDCETINLFEDTNIILITKSENDHIVYIPDSVTRINRNGITFSFADNISKYTGTLKVVGGNNLVDACCMFYLSRADVLDLSDLSTSNVMKMCGMFSRSHARYLDLNCLDTSNVTDMSRMFYNCEAKRIDVRNFNTYRVKSMSEMFSCCKVDKLDLSSFNVSKCSDFQYMFMECEAKIQFGDERLLYVYNKGIKDREEFERRKVARQEEMKKRREIRKRLAQGKRGK